MSIIQFLGAGGRFAANADPSGSNLVVALSGSSDHGFANVARLINSAAPSLPGLLMRPGVGTSFVGTKKYYANSFELGSRTSTAGWLAFQSPDVPAFSNANFTLETWLYIPSFAATQLAIFYHRPDPNLNTGFNVLITGDYWGSAPDRRGIYFGGGAGSEVNIAANCLSPNTWHHLAVVRNGSSSNSLKIYIDGVDRTSYRNATGNPTWTYVGGMFIAAPTGDTAWSSVKLQDYRVYQGVAKYTSNFTPPGPMFI